MIGPFLREKKTQNHSAYRNLKKTRDFYHETVRNVDELMANPIRTAVRFNKAKPESLTKRTLNLSGERDRAQKV